VTCKARWSSNFIETISLQFQAYDLTRAFTHKLSDLPRDISEYLRMMDRMKLKKSRFKSGNSNLSAADSVFPQHPTGQAFL